MSAESLSSVCHMQNNERLSKLYESGLPVWAILLPTYGLYTSYVSVIMQVHTASTDIAQQSRGNPDDYDA